MIGTKRKKRLAGLLTGGGAVAAAALNLSAAADVSRGTRQL
jgi:hypothetical protein